MGWFDEQIKQRKQSDQDLFSDSVLNMASAVLGSRATEQIRDMDSESKAAMDDILRYYHLKSRPVPDSVTDFDERLEYCMRPHGVMRRLVKLTDRWYRDSFGPIIAWRKNEGTPVALLPYGFGGYYLRDPITGEKTRLTAAMADQFESDAYCFYRPLPMRRLGIRDLLQYMRKCFSSADLLVLAAITLLLTAVSMVVPRAYLFLSETVYESGKMQLMIGTAMFLVSVAVTEQLISISRSLMMSRLEIKTGLSIEAAAMMRMLSLPADFFRGSSSGELSSRLDAVSQLSNQILGSLVSTGFTSLFSLLYIGQIFSFAPALALPALCIITLTTVVSTLTMLRQTQISRRMMKSNAEVRGMSYAVIRGVQKIKLAGAEKRIFSRWANVYAQNAQLEYNPPMLLKANTVINLAISMGGTLVLYYLAVKSHVPPARYLSFMASFGAVSGAFAALSGLAMTAAQIRPTLEMAEPFLKAEPENAEGREILTSITGNVELSNVSFRYTQSMPWVIHNLSLKIRAGEYIAIVGRTGCGKSTLVRLLLGFEKPDMGAVYYDGKDMNSLDLRSLRRRIGSVTQNGTLVQGDIYSNIVISAPQLTLDEAWEAAEIAGIADDIRDMPMGMHTVIAEGQGGISGGQKQRLMIARAIAPKPKMLIFDEATSALDNKTQRLVSDALDQLNCTRIVIAHRLSTIRHCDRILLMENGNIAESGTYEELIAKNGKFAELVERQRLDTTDH